MDVNYIRTLWVSVYFMYMFEDKYGYSISEMGMEMIFKYLSCAGTGMDMSNIVPVPYPLYIK